MIVTFKTVEYENGITQEFAVIDYENGHGCQMPKSMYDEMIANQAAHIEGAN